MQQDADNIYNWQIYEKILLGFASTYAWLSFSWGLAGTGLGFLFHWTPDTLLLKETLFWGYIIVSVIIHIIVFGGFAYYFPKIYILPAWGLNLYFFYLGSQKIILFLIYLDDPDKFYYFKSGEDRFHFFTSRDVYMTVIDLFFLVVLYRPALFCFRRFIGRFF